MAFPTSPSVNDKHTYGGTKYKWNGTAWQLFDGTGIGAATGGTITTDGDYKVHTFNSSGTFTVTTAPDYVEYLVTRMVVAEVLEVIEQQQILK